MEIPFIIWLFGWAITVGITIKFNDAGPMMWFVTAMLSLMFWPVLAIVLAQQWWDGELR